MLEFFRKLSQSTFFKIFFAAIVISFVNWGVGAGAGKRSQDIPVISAGDVDVSLQAMYNELIREGKRLEAVLGYRFGLENLVRMGMLDEVIRRMTTETVLAAEAEDLGLYASDKVIKETIYTNPNYFGGGESFNRPVFEDMIRKNGFKNEREYISYLRKDMVHNQLADVVKPEIPVPAVMAERIYKYRNEKRIADVVRVEVVNLKIKEKPKTEDLKVMYEDNKENYKYPSYRAISFVALDTAELKKTTKVSEEEVLAKYEETKNDVAEETRDVEQMQFGLTDEDKAKATIAASKVKDGQKFADIAKTFAGQDDELTKLGWVSAEDLPSELGAEVFEAKKGDIVGPVKSPVGWHVVRVNDVKGGEESNTLEARREAITETILAEKVFNQIQSLSEQLQDELGGGATLDQAAEAVSAKVVKFENIDIDGKEKTGKEIENSQFDKRLVELAFSLQKDEISDVVESDSGYVVVRVDEIKEVETKSFDVVKKEIIAAWTKEKQDELAEKKSKEIVARLEKGQSIKRYLDKKVKVKKGEEPPKQGISEKKAVEVIRKGNTGGLSKEGAEQLFSMDIASVTMLPDETGYNIIKLKKIVPVDPKTNEEGVKALTETLAKEMSEDVYYQYVASLGNKHRVILREDIINASFRNSGANANK
ncbi:MAG: hypothetical protein GY804_13360 [Alphaproteobacteria bacterium]|nr:hypothetical protein [Alphaproteobacteria bacterium]